MFEASWVGLFCLNLENPRSKTTPNLDLDVDLAAVGRIRHVYKVETPVLDSMYISLLILCQYCIYSSSYCSYLRLKALWGLNLKFFKTNLNTEEIRVWRLLENLVSLISTFFMYLFIIFFALESKTSNMINVKFCIKWLNSKEGIKS